MGNAKKQRTIAYQNAVVGRVMNMEFHDWLEQHNFDRLVKCGVIREAHDGQRIEA